MGCLQLSSRETFTHDYGEIAPSSMHEPTHAHAGKPMMTSPARGRTTRRRHGQRTGQGADDPIGEANSNTILETCRMRLAPPRLLLTGAVALSLASCERPPAPVVVPQPPPPPPPIVHRPVASNWSFHAGDVCTATAGGGTLALDVAASRDTLEIVVRMPRGAAIPPSRSVPIAFSGMSGAWTVTGHKAGSHRVIASQPMSEDQAGQILVLLGGGVVRVGNRSEGVPELRIPNSGASGRDWFECVRRQLFP
jgi:hypothetical protein